MTNVFIDIEEDIEEFEDNETVVVEDTPSTKLARCRRIEELHEERLLKAELTDFEEL
jgi:hypothetical protein